MPKVVGFVYDADHHCEDCTRNYVKKHWHKDFDDPPDYIPNVDGVISGDIEFHDGEFNTIHPMFDDEETDTPIHCSDCHEYIETAWTDEGVTYVFEALRDYLISGYGNTDALDVWADELSYACPDTEIDVTLDLYNERRKYEREHPPGQPTH